MRTPTFARVHALVAAALLLLGPTAQAQNPFEGFPPAAPSTPAPPPPGVPDAPGGALPTPTTPNLPTLPQALPPLAAPVPELDPLAHTGSAIVLTPLDPTAPDALAWGAHRALALPPGPYLPPADTGIRLLAITHGPVPTALVHHAERHLVVRAGDLLPNGVRIERIDPNAITVGNDAGMVRIALAQRGAPQ